MAEVNVSLRSIPDTAAAVGWAGAHSLVVDRPDGAARGSGLGFNGGQMLALAIGGCFCNDLHYVAAAEGVELTSLAVEVKLRLAGDPLLATAAEMTVTVTAAQPDADVDAIIAKAKADSTVSNSLIRGFPVAVAAS